MKIVVRGTNWIGDAVMSIPAFRYIRRIFPDAHISLHTRSWAEALFQNADFIDEILPFRREMNSLQTTRQEARVWRERKFDLAILFTNSFQTALLTKLGKAKTRFGYRNEGRSFLLTNPVEKPEWKNERHEVYYYLNLISEVEKHYFGEDTFCDEDEINVSIPVSSEQRQRARSILEDTGLDLSKRTVALGVGSTNSRAKRWQAESYAMLADKLQTEMDANVLLLGSEDELTIAMQVIDFASVKPFHLVGKTSLSEAVGVLGEIDLLVSNDMGLAHIAPTVGTKTLTIFGPTNPKTTKPIGAEIVRHKVDCAPCMLRDCPIDHPCMTGISPENVFEIAKEILDRDLI